MRKSIKIVGTTLLAATMAIASAACGGNGGVGGGIGGGAIDANVLKIRVLKKGYGDEYVDALVDAYKKKTGKEVDYKSTEMANQVESELKAGASVNDTDLYFHILSLGKVLKDGATYTKGWDGLVFEDLSDIMTSVPEGYGTEKTVREMLNQYAYQGTLYEGKSYGIPYALGLEGFVYNEDLMKEFFGNDYHTPRTTGEMFEMFDFIAKGGNESGEKGDYKVKVNERYNTSYQVYPFVYSGTSNYMLYCFIPFWAQQLGQENFYKLLEGKDASGMYSDAIFASDERYNALQVVHDMITVGNLDSGAKYSGYVKTDARMYNYVDAQSHFLLGEAVFMPTGDWVEQEMSGSNSNAANIKFMKTPVISAIIDTLPDKTITTDEQLQEVVAYVDSGKTDAYGAYSAADIAKVAEARLTINCESETHMMVVPAYANNIEGAKDFIKFVLSKEGQEIQMKYSHGNSVPYALDYEATYGATYSALSGFSKSKFELAKSANFVGLLYNQPIAYKGGMKLVDITRTTLESAFGNNTASSSYQSAVDFFTEEYGVVQENFPTWLAAAGLKNN